jgi:hypothetical protein
MIAQRHRYTSRFGSPLLLTLLLGTTIGLSGCGREKPTGGGVDEDQTGRIRVSLNIAAAEGIGAVRFDVSQNGMVVASSTVPIAAGSPDGSAGDGAADPLADAFFVLAPGAYDVVVTPLDNEGQPNRTCAPATGKVTVIAGATQEITLTLRCNHGANGGLDVVVTTDDVPVITGLTFDPSKFTHVCQPVKISVAAAAASNEPLTYSWQVISQPQMATPAPGSQSLLVSQGPTATFDSSTAGDYVLLVMVSSPAKSVAMLSFPVHVLDGPGCQGSQILTGHFGPPPGEAFPVAGPVPPTTVLGLAISLPVRDQAGLSSFIQQVSDPTNPAYGHYLTRDAFIAQHGATESDYGDLTNWATGHGFTVAATYPNRLLLDVTAPASTIEVALHANLVYRTRADNSLFVTTDREPSIDLAVPVAHISGIGEAVAPKRHALNGSGPSANYWGADYRKAYLGPGSPCSGLTGAGQTVGLFEFDGFNLSDVLGFAAAQTPPVPVASVVSVPNPGFGAGGNAAEVVMDIEAVAGIAPGASIVVFEGDPFFSGFGDSILHAMANSRITTASASWSFPKGAGSQAAIDQMAATGISYFTSSGDTGTIGDLGSLTIGDPEDSRDFENQTVVGGTMLQTNPLGSNPYYQSESTWNDSLGATGGGIMGGGNLLCWPWPDCMNATPIPEYQIGVDMTMNGGSTMFRNYPDVSMVADNLALFLNGGAVSGFGGTSNSAPLWAGFIALANQQRMINGLPTVGFANPAIYAIGKTGSRPAPNLYTTGFNDIADGVSNAFMGAPGFTSVAGYDLSTGWGTPTCGLITQLSSTSCPSALTHIHDQFGADCFTAIDRGPNLSIPCNGQRVALSTNVIQSSPGSTCTARWLTNNVNDCSFQVDYHIPQTCVPDQPKMECDTQALTIGATAPLPPSALVAEMLRDDGRTQDGAHVYTIGNMCDAGFHHDPAGPTITVVQNGGSSCSAAWASSDPHDCRVTVTYMLGDSFKHVTCDTKAIELADNPPASPPMCP